MKKLILVMSLLMLGFFARAQHLETTIKIVGGKARIAVKAVGGAVTGEPSNFIFSVAIPVANAAANLNAPTKLIPSRIPTTLASITSYQDATYKYFLLFYFGLPGASVTFANDTEYELLELNWAGAAQSCPVTLISMANGNPSAPVSNGLWFNYLELSTGQASFGDVLFYSTPGQSNVNAQMAPDYSSGEASITSILISLPVTFLNFSGYKSGAKNVLKWSTANELNNTGFEVQRSADGVNYAPIGFADTKAPGGASTTELNYTFDDNSPLAAKKSYYRLRQVDMDSRSKLSTIVMISGDKSKITGITGVFPNPASDLVNVIINAPQRENVVLVVMDISGRTISQKTVNVESGSNTVPVDIAGLAKGSYFVKVVSPSADSESAVSQFVKQ